ncbi:DNA-binding transcriptional regulator, LysR family [Amycolatopsis arida]|uniref:DNA-binding transcriptional regulator, LysR family n=1 Tax=Amycolatopsis arida TaxID=587909 RepID=A0A1I5XFB7_9PSEU|nr:LysR family transcriptional regulator [Amycolatopsis arida]TDX97492.1 DNA-binding transcriptional LysR family regulator [Amycolatopsis arida]SFQ30604.1 DNA-binding transcriptional regulator, LysR family [Amycolatopsis arida]
MDLELRHLKVVCAIADTGSVTKAAARLGLAQPALSAQLHRIERTLGGALFERDRRGARPTALGELVLARARVLLPAVRGLQEDATRLAGAAANPHHCRIGAINTPVLRGLVHRFAADFPHAHVATHTSWSVGELVGMLVAGRLDFALIGLCGTASPPTEPGLVWREVGLDAVGVLLPETHPLAAGDEVRLADLALARWAATRGEGCFGDCFAAACTRAGFTPLPTYETDVVSCIELAQAGDAVVLCKPSLPPLARLRALPLAGAPLRWRHYLGWHEEAPATVLGERMARYAEEAFAAAVRRNPAYARWWRRNADELR